LSLTATPARRGAQFFFFFFFFFLPSFWLFKAHIPQSGGLVQHPVRPHRGNREDLRTVLWFPVPLSLDFGRAAETSSITFCFHTGFPCVETLYEHG
jgi:hypothetical protein